MNRRTIPMLVLAAAMIGEAGAQQYVYPAKGQTPQQQKTDESACYTWAVEQTGFDPAKPPPPAPTAKARGVPRGPRLHGQVKYGARLQSARAHAALPGSICRTH